MSAARHPSALRLPSARRAASLPRAAALAALLAAGAAGAEEAPAPPEPEAACTVEIGLLCPGAPAASEALRACLRERGDRLPDGCRAQAEALAAAPVHPPGSQDVRTACRDDFARHCAELGSEAPREAALRCLADHVDAVDEACRSALLHPKPRPRRPRVDCVQAQRALCPQADSEYEREQCLAYYRADLPPECRPRRHRPGR